MQLHSSLWELPYTAYRGFILDLWGVIHDGATLYPGVRETLARLRDEEKQVIFLSNAPRRAHKAAQVLASLGIHEAMYDHVITSGEAVYHYLSVTKEIGKRYYYIGPDKDLDILDGLWFIRSGLANADFLLNVGFFNDYQTMEDMESLLTTSRALGRPMLCVNPDRVVVKQDGTRLLCAGTIADAYEKIGGKVHWFGKPYAEVYQLCLQRFDGIAKQEILAVGDSLETDIKGAAGVGIDSVLIGGGILKEQLYSGGGINEVALQSLVQEYGATPHYVIPSFGAQGSTL